ncbi:MAG: hypothetical protein IJW56_09665 [Bacteroides sp.]|nr:hypothetical protein [Bacteroides sp.]
MDAGNTTWVITFEQGTPKVEIVRKTSEKPMLECPSEREMSTEWDSGLYLSKEKGVRINMIRFIYTLGLMNYIRDEKGNKVPFKKVFHAFGKLFHADFSRYNNDLTRTMEENTSIEKQTEVFRLMSEVFYERIRL